MLNKVREYRWELWLFFGIPVAVGIVHWAIYAVFSPVSDSYDRQYFVWLYLRSDVAWFIVLAFSYCWVRRLKRPLLRLLWQHSLVAITVRTTLSLVVVNLLYEEDLTPLQQGLMASLSVGISIPMQLVVLVWFARRASRGGFKYALVFLGVTAFPGLVLTGRLEIWSLGFYFGGIFLSMMFTLVAAWVLHRADSGGVVTGRAISMLFLVALLVQASAFVLSAPEGLVGRWTLNFGFTAVFLALQYGVAVGVTYLVRVREIEPYFDLGEQPPMDQGEEPPTDEGDDEFVGLYLQKRGDSDD